LQQSVNQLTLGFAGVGYLLPIIVWEFGHDNAT
jgi:hypothetical protein